MGVNGAQIAVVIIMDGRICHRSWVSNGRSMAYLLNFLVVAFKGNLSLEYVMLRFGKNGSLVVGVALMMHIEY